MSRCPKCHQRTERLVASYFAGDLCPACVAEAAAEYEAQGWPKASWDYPADASIAVVGRHFGHIACFRGQSPLVTQFWRPNTLGHLIEWAKGVPAKVPLRQIWVHASALDLFELPSELPIRRPGDEPPGHAWLEGSRTKGLAPWIREGGIEICVPRWSGHTLADSGRFVNPNPWAAATEVLALHWELSAFAATVGHRWVSSGAVTSDAMILDHWGKEITDAVIPVGDWPDLASTTLEAPDRWVRAPEGKEEKARYLFGFDLNANYLGAASNLLLPSGAPGWCANLALPPPPEPAPLPAGWWRTEDGGWCTTPGVEGRRLAGDGWAWERDQCHQFLQPWYKALRDARAALVAGPAKEAVKAVYRQGWGRLISTNRGTGTWATRMYQPYWGQAVEASARSRLRRRIAAMPQRPVAVDTDAIFVLSSLPDARIVATGLGLSIGDGLGEWHVLGRGTGKAARAALGNPDAAAALDELRGLM